MADRLPIKLGKEPLVDAIFEFRFSSAIPAAAVLPGILYGRLSGFSQFQELPQAQIPKPVRESDPFLANAPILTTEWRNFHINIGDSVLSISNKYPYQGWSSFKPAIMEIANTLADYDFIQTLNRFSIKYIDIFDKSLIPQNTTALNMNLAIANHSIVNETMQFRVEIPRDGFIHAVQVISSANATLPNGKTFNGLLIDVDTIANLPPGTHFRKAMENFETSVESIHTSNKSVFFDCLTEQTLELLEPKYA
ncbi:TIGR04255 family protein [Methylophilus sp. DW102]|uniref:TIGR04255 family protein n=1 Tax=Methylophilus sp. DW102 TaxID=3095607 RepID=UPI00308508A4|nr:TIGR04255 family protein [Methylophilus sp. DW102]